MRIIAGEFRSRRIRTIRGLDVRPTPDRLREALFNVLAPRLPGATFLDVYAGCGAVGIEALSRGAGRVIFIEAKPSAVNKIQENLLSLGVSAGFDIHCGRAARLLGQFSADVVFLDPPYPLEREYELSMAALADNPPPLAIFQHASRQQLPERCGPLHRIRVLRQGDNSLSFYE